jgi:hypothetical protein
MKTNPSFLDCYELINKDHKKFKKVLSNKELSHSEKTILKALLAFKKGQCQESMHLLDSVTTESNEYLGAYKNFIFGMIKNHQGHYPQASVYLVNAYFTLKKLYKFQEIHRPINVLAMLYFNVRDVNRLKKYYEEFKSIKDDSFEHNHLNFDYQIYIAILENKFEKAQNLIDELIQKYPDKIRPQLNKYEIFKFMLAIKQDDIDLAYEIAKEYGKNGGFKVKSNYKFMLSCLNFYSKNAPFYVYKRDFQDNDFLYHQLKFLQSLNLHNIDEAKKILE